MPKQLPVVIVHTDGSCDNNHVGGWAASIQYKDDMIYLNGSEEDVTNNQMELLAVIKAIEYLHGSTRVELFTDSKYVIAGITQVRRWKKREWRTADDRPVQHQALWERMLELLEQHQVKPHWVKGHAGHVGNEQVDALAQLARKYRSGRKYVI